MSEKADKILTRLIDLGKGWKSLSSNEWVDLLSYDSEYASKCDACDGWEQFNGSDWVELLSRQPKLVCKLKDSMCAEFKTSDWVKLLKIQPKLVGQYEESCHWQRNGLYEKLIAYLDSNQYGNTYNSRTRKVSLHVDLNNPSEKAAYEARQDILNIWSLFGAIASKDKKKWIDLLVKYPSCPGEVAFQCSRQGVWGELSGDDWARLLVIQPQFAKYCDAYDGWEQFNGSDWLELLKNNPKFAEKCGEYNGGEKFTIWDTIELLKIHPYLVDICPIMHHTDATAWMCILDELPQLLEKCDEVGGFKEFGIKSSDWQDYYNEQINCWSYLLIKHPEWADRCDKFKGWVDFQAKDWVALLKQHPCFADKCNTADGWKSFKNHNWVNLLQQQPQFAVQCGSYNCWQNFNGFDWVELLRERPEFADKCERFGGWREIDFSAITTKYRDDYVVHGKMPGDKGQSVAVSRIVGEMSASFHTIPCKKGYTYFDSEGKELLRTDYAPPFCGRWAELLEKQPQFATKCDEYNGWEAFDGFDWYLLLSAQPCFVSKCNELGGWEKLFHFRPKEYQYAEEPDDEYGVWDYWSEYAHEPLYVAPKEYDTTFSRENRLPASDCTKGLPVNCWMNEDLSKKARHELGIELSKSFWIYHLAQEQGFALVLPWELGAENIWELFTIEDWKFAIRNRTDFLNSVSDEFDGDLKDAEYNPDFDYWDDKFWNALVSAWPDFFEGLGYYEKRNNWFTPCRAWSLLLRHRPDWITHIKNEDWEWFGKKDWERLLHPHWQFLDKSTIPMDSWFWMNCLQKAPQFAGLCEQYGGWSKFSNTELCKLLEGNAELLDYCARYIKWDSLGVKDWLGLMAIKSITDKIMELCDKYNGWRVFEERTALLGWTKLLEANPQLVDKCDNAKVWEMFTGHDWQVLLSAQPQLSAYCDACQGWQKLNEDDWMRLVAIQARFAETHAKVKYNDANNKELITGFIEKSKEFVDCENRRRIAAKNASYYDDDGCYYDDWSDGSPKVHEEPGMD